MTGALNGYHVLDCSQIIAGPLASSLLAEMGADVVKVEPLEGEPWRLQAEFIPKESRGYIAENRSKRGLAIDLKRPEAARVRDDLILWADVIVTNFRPGVAASLGLDYASARVIRPDIIYCQNTAFGPLGPDGQRRGYDIIAQAMSGLVTAGVHLNEQGVPLNNTIAIADKVTACLMAFGITAALLHRERTGEGQQVDASLLHSALFLQATFKEISALDTEPRAQRLEQLAAARAHGATMAEVLAERRAAMPELLGNIYYRMYKTRDSYIAVGCLGPGPRARFQKALDFVDPRYQKEFGGTHEELVSTARRLVEVCEAAFAERTTAEWLRHLDVHDVPCGPVNFTDELWEDPQVLANGYIAEYEHTLLGPLRAASPPVRMSATPTEVQRASPALGEHTDEVLGEIGYDADRIEVLRRGGVIL